MAISSIVVSSRVYRSWTTVYDTLKWIECACLPALSRELLIFDLHADHEGLEVGHLSLVLLGPLLPAFSLLALRGLPCLQRLHSIGQLEVALLELARSRVELCVFGLELVLDHFRRSFEFRVLVLERAESGEQLLSRQALVLLSH